MKIKRVPVDVSIEYLYCDCGEEMEKDNVVLTTNPPKHKYKCPKCGQLNKMNFFQVLFSRRGDNTRKLKCTKCNEIAYMERQVR